MILALSLSLSPQTKRLSTTSRKPEVKLVIWIDVYVSNSKTGDLESDVTDSELHAEAI